MNRLALLVLLAGACAPSNGMILKDLERAPARPEYDALLAEPLAPVALERRARRTSLPMLRGRLPTVMGRVNGVEMPIVLDTGTSHVMLSGNAAREADAYVPPGEPVGIVRPGHTATHRLCVFDSLELGGNRFGPGVATVPTARMSIPQWAELPTTTFAIVGCAILSHFEVTFDFETRRVLLRPHGRSPSIDLVHTPVEINGHAFYMLIDSGATNVVIEPWAANELGLISRAQLDRHREEVENESDVVYSHMDLDAVQVRGQTFHGVRAIALRTFGQDAAEQGVVIAGLLGLQAFGPRVWTVDYGRRRLDPR